MQYVCARFDWSEFGRIAFKSSHDLNCVPSIRSRSAVESSEIKSTKAALLSVTLRSIENFASTCASGLLDMYRITWSIKLRRSPPTCIGRNRVRADRMHLQEQQTVVCRYRLSLSARRWDRYRNTIRISEFISSCGKMPRCLLPKGFH
nr:hypothetical protein CFP56_71005 [Quercus suber]